MTPERLVEIVSRLPHRISGVLDPGLQTSSDHLALVEKSGTWTYGQLSGVIKETEPWLREAGIRAGDRVMLVCENCRAFVALLLALTNIDAWPVLVNARLSSREVDEIRD